MPCDVTSLGGRSNGTVVVYLDFKHIQSAYTYNCTCFDFLLCLSYSFTFCTVTSLGGHRDGPVTSRWSPLPSSGHAL